MSTKNKFRLNVMASYHKSVDNKMTKHLIHSILKNFACLYRLDYCIDENSQAFGDVESDLFASTDLIYFRSHRETQIDLKTFQKLLDQVFAYNNILADGIEVYYQYQKHLREFPFPHNFYRPLNYPFVESHKDNQMSLKCVVDSLMEEFPDLYID